MYIIQRRKTLSPEDWQYWVGNRKSAEIQFALIRDLQKTQGELYSYKLIREEVLDLID